VKKLLDIFIGDVFGDLKCISYHLRKNKNGSHSTVYTMKCNICGREKDMLSSTIRLGHGITHKACGKGIKTLDPIFYSRWQAMRTRTTNENYEHADCYSKKGIDSDEFKYFIDFYDKMYPSYLEMASIIGKENTSLERIDNSKGYSVENCKWIHKHDQPKNTSRTVVFKVIYPDGHEEIHSNAREFAILHNLNSETIIDCLNGKTKTHRGHMFLRLRKEAENELLRSEEK